jgi:hypothetical protein
MVRHRRLGVAQLSEQRVTTLRYKLLTRTWRAQTRPVAFAKYNQASWTARSASVRPRSLSLSRGPCMARRWAQLGQIRSRFVMTCVYNVGEPSPETREEAARTL